MKPRKRFKIVLYVPASHAEQVRNSMGDAGAGIIGNYTHCSFTVKGIGRFRPTREADPTIGKADVLEEVEEDRIETVCEEEKLHAVLKSIRDSHPYEEPAVDVYPIEVVE